MMINATLAVFTPSGPCGDLVSFSITLSAAMDVPVTFTVTSSEPTDTIFSTPTTIAIGTKDWGFFLQPHTCGPRTVTIACDNPDVTLLVDHITYNSQCICPDDDGDTAQSATFVKTLNDCANHHFQFRFDPATLAERDLYGDAPVAVLITE
jgi:hypothetical protein